MGIKDHIRRARRAQQEHAQRHDVQLEVPGWDAEEEALYGPPFFGCPSEFEIGRRRMQDELASDFNERRQAQIEDETGRDPRD